MMTNRAPLGSFPPRPRRRWVFAVVAMLATIPTAAPAPSRMVDRPNVLPLVMKTPHGGFNRMVISVTVCAPGTERCATVDDVMVDTGSTGLRLEASALPPWLRLPPFPGPCGMPLDFLILKELYRQCTAFVERGIRKLRITGGEPLVRLEAMQLFGKLSRRLATDALHELTLTTNESQLARLGDELSSKTADVYGIRTGRVDHGSYLPTVRKAALFSRTSVATA